jgi:hypothetical protein
MNDDATLHDEELREVAQRLGARAAERLDVERTAQAVVVRLRLEPRRRAWTWFEPTWLRIAAALVVVAGAGAIARARWHERTPAAAAVVPLEDDLSGLTPAELREAIGALDQPLGEETGSGADTGLEGLGPDELRALLRSLKG